MFLLTRNRRVKRPLALDELNLLKTALTPETELFSQQQKMLNIWRESNFWIQCDCLGEDADFDDRPIMCLRRLPSGLVILALNPTSHPHKASCKFFRLIKYKAYETGQKLNQNKARTDFVFHRHAIEKVDDSEENKEPSKGSSKASMPGLQRFLYNLAHKAGIHQFSIKTNLKERNYIYRLELAAQEFTINKKFKLSDYLYSSIGDQQKAIHRLNVTSQYWTGYARPHCVFIFPIDVVVKSDTTDEIILRRYRFNDDGVSNEDMRLPNDCDLVMPGRAVINKSNPCMAVVTFADVSKTDSAFFAPAKALVMPVVSKDHLLIVESNYERVVAKCLRRLQMFLKNKTKVNFFIRIIKPLDDLVTPVSKEVCRPDFVIEIQNRKVILEVMGSHEDDYIERKERQVPLMNEIAPVYQFDALQAEKDGELEVRAYTACKEAIIALLSDDPLFEAECFDEFINSLI